MMNPDDLMTGPALLHLMAMNTFRPATVRDLEAFQGIAGDYPMICDTNADFLMIYVHGEVHVIGVDDDGHNWEILWEAGQAPVRII